ncbi:MAG TPA: tetratricopeptide repeat protein, partial [Gemmatimonadales bacterium]|nr:tetratricopeptide repeat protein [Gemmatimonadales bacterium]
MNTKISGALTALLLVGSGPLAAQAPRLGTVSFPNSGSRAAQRPFLRGVLLLHSFEYDDAAAAFREAQRADPGFALAYWGEAMTLTHPVWNEQALDSARAVLGRLAGTTEGRRAKAPTPRERGYLEAVEILYGEGAKPRRDTLYSAAMARLSAAYPNDLEAKSFYALSLMGLSQATRNVPAYMRAGALAEEVFLRNADHPGAAHYLIHAFDDPVHAPLGLRAARAYAKIAPGADHAQHMTSHIFVAMGMWDETVAANEAAAGPDRSTWPPGHYTAWLDYGYVQQGRMAEARRLLDTARPNVGSPPRPARLAYLLTMRAHYLVSTERWTDSVAAWPLEGSGLPVPQAMDAFALGYAALRRGERPVAEHLLGRLDSLAKVPHTEDRYGGSPQVAVILAMELRALLRATDGATDEAIALLREASTLEEAMPLEYGPPDVVKPTQELLGELLLAKGKPAPAQQAFVRALALTPRRALSLLGLARAAAAAGDTAAAAAAYADLRQVWHRGDA